MAGRLLVAAEAADLLSVPESWVRQEARADRIPHVRLGARYVRFEEAELVAWWEARRSGPSRSGTGTRPVPPARRGP